MAAGPVSRMAARQSLTFPRGGGHLEAFGEFLASHPVLARRLALNGFVLMAGLLLMLARTSPALASDNGHGQGRAQDHTRASAVAQGHDSQSAHNEQTIGGDGDGKKGKGKGKGEGGTGSGSHSQGSSSHTSGSGTSSGSGHSAAPESKVSSGDSSAAKTSGHSSSDAHSRSEEHTSELQSPCNLVCRLLLEKKKKERDNMCLT